MTRKQKIPLIHIYIYIYIYIYSVQHISFEKIGGSLTEVTLADQTCRRLVSITLN